MPAPSPSGPMYHAGARRLQDAFDSRRIADRLEEVTVHDALTAEDRALVEGARMFFLATADAEGRPEVSYKGGDPGFVRVLDDRTIAFPHYDGNGMFRSLGNVLVNPNVHLLFVDFEDPDRLRIAGKATVETEGPLVASFHGAQAACRVAVERIFPNCPRYVHRMKLVEPSKFVPREGSEPPVPGWKRAPVFADALPKKR